MTKRFRIADVASKTIHNFEIGAEVKVERWGYDVVAKKHICDCIGRNKYNGKEEEHTLWASDLEEIPESEERP